MIGLTLFGGLMTIVHSITVPPVVVAPESFDTELSVPPSNAVVGSGAPEQVYEIPRCGDDQV
jgi:hypothetical protein